MMLVGGSVVAAVGVEENEGDDEEEDEVGVDEEDIDAEEKEETEEGEGGAVKKTLRNVELASSVLCSGRGGRSKGKRLASLFTLSSHGPANTRRRARSRSASAHT